MAQAQARHASRPRAVSNMASRRQISNETLQKALTCAVSTVCKSLNLTISSEDQKREKPHGSESTGTAQFPSSEDEFLLEELPIKKKRKSEAKHVLPSAFLGKQAQKNKGKAKKKMFTYDRDIICLPRSYEGKSGLVKVPRNKEYLARSGLIGKIRLSSDMTEREIMHEITSVFKVPMGDDSLFDFKILTSTGGKNKQLMIPALSPGYKWTASAVAGKNAKTPIYILAMDTLKNLGVADTTSESETSDLENQQKFPSYINLYTSGSEKHKLPEGPGETPETAIVIDKKPNNLSESVQAGSKHENEAEHYKDYVDMLGEQENSLCHTPLPPPVSPITPTKEYSNGPSVSLLIKNHRCLNLPVDEEDNVRIVIRRRHILDDTFHQLKGGLDVTKHIKVTFVSEPAHDDGGPMREYLHLLMKALAAKNSLFCGEETRRVPTHSVVELEDRTYYHVGSILALSLLHGGPSPSFLAPPVADYIVYGVQDVKAAPEDVPDIEMRKKILKIQQVDDAESLKELMDSEEYEFRFDLGISQPSKDLRLSDKDRIVSFLVKHFVILNVKAELDQILCGLSSTLNVLQLIRENASAMWHLFVYNKPRHLTWDKVYDMLPPVMSTEGSNMREAEEATIMRWIHLLKFVEGSSGCVRMTSPQDGEVITVNFVLEDVLKFITGAPAAPPLGFIPEPSITFHSFPLLPLANTCANTLSLPVSSVTDEEFVYNVVSGMVNSPGFGRI